MAATALAGTGTIRSANLADADALSRLFASTHLDVMPLGAADISAWLDRGYLIVLDLGSGALGAAAHVAIDCTDDEEVHGRLRFFVTHPSLAGTGAEDRLVAALLAICEASGCVDLDVEPRLGRVEARRR